MALRVLEEQQAGDDPGASTTVPVDVSIAGQTTVQPAPSDPATSLDVPSQTVPPSVLGTTVDRDDTETTGDG